MNLKDNAVKEFILRLKEEGLSQREISHKTGIPKSTIGDFLCGNSYSGWLSEHSPAQKEKEITSKEYLKIIVIPDTQVKPDVPINHLLAAGNYIAEHKPDVVVVIGDWWDMPSLNRFGSKLELDGRRVKEDLEAGNEAMDLFLSPFKDLEGYSPRLVFTVGNHDSMVRIPRILEEMPNLEGLLVDTTKDFLEDRGFEVHDFLEIVNINGIRFSHFFQNPHSAKKAPLGGAIDTMLKNCGFSFVQGHTQTHKIGKHYLSDGTRRLGIVSGAFYQHSENYMGVQGNLSHWRGIIQLNEVKDGAADVCELSLDYLLRKYL